MKQTFICLMGALLLAVSAAVAADSAQKVEATDSSEVAAEETDTIKTADQIVVYYLHGNRRCMTCRKLEAYSEEAVTSAFKNELKDSAMVWRVVNFEEEGNEHYAKDYQLYTQSLILSRVHDGKEVEWKNLNKIWKLVGHKEDFVTYVQAELQGFMKQAEK